MVQAENLSKETRQMQDFFCKNVSYGKWTFKNHRVASEAVRKLQALNKNSNMPQPFILIYCHGNIVELLNMPGLARQELFKNFVHFTNDLVKVYIGEQFTIHLDKLVSREFALIAAPKLANYINQMTETVNRSYITSGIFAAVVNWFKENQYVETKPFKARAYSTSVIVELTGPINLRRFGQELPTTGIRG